MLQRPLAALAGAAALAEVLTRMASGGGGDSNRTWEEGVVTWGDHGRNHKKDTTFTVKLRKVWPVWGSGILIDPPENVDVPNRATPNGFPWYMEPRTKTCGPIPGALILKHTHILHVAFVWFEIVFLGVDSYP